MNPDTLKTAARRVLCLMFVSLIACGIDDLGGYANYVHCHCCCFTIFRVIRNGPLNGRSFDFGAHELHEIEGRPLGASAI